MRRRKIRSKSSQPSWEYTQDSEKETLDTKLIATLAQNARADNRSGEGFPTPTVIDSELQVLLQRFADALLS